MCHYACKFISKLFCYVFCINTVLFDYCLYNFFFLIPWGKVSWSLDWLQILTKWSRMTLDFWSCLYLPSGRITGMHHHTHCLFVFILFYFIFFGAVLGYQTWDFVHVKWILLPTELHLHPCNTLLNLNFLFLFKCLG